MLKSSIGLRIVYYFDFPVNLENETHSPKTNSFLNSLYVHDSFFNFSHTFSPLFLFTHFMHLSEMNTYKNFQVYWLRIERGTPRRNLEEHSKKDFLFSVRFLLRQKSSSYISKTFKCLLYIVDTIPET